MFSVGRARYQHLYVGRGYVDCASGVRGIQTGFAAFEAQPAIVALSCEFGLWLVTQLLFTSPLLLSVVAARSF
jgi:hypothetical protein